MTGPDDYESVLGIPPGPRPPNHYELLGLELFEADPERIVAAYQRRLAQTEQSRAVPADRLRPLAHEIVLAKTCLLTEKTKADYDRHLNLRLIGGSEIMLLEPPVVSRAATPVEAEVVASPADDEIQIERADNRPDDQPDDESGFDAADESGQFGQPQFGDVSIAAIGAEKKGRARKPKSRRLFWIVTGLEGVVVACLFFYLRNRQQAEPEPPAPQFVVRPQKQPVHPIDSPPDNSRERQQRRSPQQPHDPFAPAGAQEPPSPSPEEPSDQPAAGSPQLAALPQTPPAGGQSPATPSPAEPSPPSPSAETTPPGPPATGPANVPPAPAMPADAPVAPLAPRPAGDWTLRFAGSRDWAIDGDMLVLSADEKQAIAALAGQRVFTLRDPSTKKPLAVMQYDKDGDPNGIVPARLEGDYRAVLTFNDRGLSRALVFDETGHCLFFAEYRKNRTKMFCLVERGLPLAVQIWRNKDADAYWIDRGQATPQAIKQSELSAQQAEKLTEALKRLTGLEKTIRDGEREWKNDLKKWLGQHDKALRRRKPAAQDEYLKKLFDEQHADLDKLLGQF